MSKRPAIEVITLDDDDDDLMALCDTFSSKPKESVKQTSTDFCKPSTSRGNGILDYVNVYRKTEKDSFEVVPTQRVIENKNQVKTGNDIEDFLLDDEFDFDDDDLLQPIPLFATKKPSTVKSPPNRTVQTKITSSFSRTSISSQNAFARTEEMSVADIQAISEALEDLEKSYNNNSQIDAETLQIIELINLEDLLNAEAEVELESYNENAAQIRSLGIVDPDLEHLDPNPDIYVLYRQFDFAYFEGFLTTKALKLGWANNFYSVAGTYYSQKDGVPTILLSANLLTLRPRKDLVETLLHEMIHAYVNLKRIKDNNDHGNVFQFHMRRINQTAGTSITIYHSFHDEVSYLRKYIWRCSGSKCQSVQPYRGFISMPTKRKPSRWDKAFRIHQQIGCTGEFQQVSQNFDSDAPKKKKTAKK